MAVEVKNKHNLARLKGRKHDDECLDRDAQAIRDAVAACRLAMIDLPLAHKALS